MLLRANGKDAGGVADADPAGSAISARVISIVELGAPE
jgi:hypothetical protein